MLCCRLPYTDGCLGSVGDCLNKWQSSWLTDFVMKGHEWESSELVSRVQKMSDTSAWWPGHQKGWDRLQKRGWGSVPYSSCCLRILDLKPWSLLLCGLSFSTSCSLVQLEFFQSHHNAALLGYFWPLLSGDLRSGNFAAFLFLLAINLQTCLVWSTCGLCFAQLQRAGLSFFPQTTFPLKN